MTQNAQKIKTSSDTSKNKIDPTERLDFILALSIDDRLSDHDPKVASILFSFRNNKSGICCPAHETIAERANMSVSKVRRSIKRMAKAGWITITKQRITGGLQTSNKYDMNFTSACSAVSKLYDSKVVPAAGAATTGSACRSACSAADTPGAQQWTPRVFSSEQPGCSAVNNEPRVINSGVEPGVSNPEKQDSRIATRRRNATAPFQGKNGASHRTGHHNQDYVDHSDNRSPIERFLEVFPDEWTTGEDFEDRKPSSREEDIRVAEIHLRKLLRKGTQLDIILEEAKRFADEYADTDSNFIYKPASWLAHMEFDDLTPPDPANDDMPVRKVSGSDIDPDYDPPF